MPAGIHLLATEQVQKRLGQRLRVLRARSDMKAFETNSASPFAGTTPRGFIDVGIFGYISKCHDLPRAF